VSWQRIGILALLVAALGGYLWLYEVPKAREEKTKAKLVAVDKTKVTAIDLVAPDHEVALAKTDKGWRLTKPVDAPADDGAVTALIGALADAEVQKTIDELPSDLAAFGLDKPTVTVKVTAAGTESPPVAVGKNTAIGGKTYVRKGDEPKLYLVASTLGFALNKQAKDLRDKQLLNFQDDAVTRVDIMAENGQTTSLKRKGKDAWTVDPGGYAADPTEVRSYLSSLRATRAVDFPDDAATDLAKYGLDKPRLQVTVVAGKEGADTHTLLFGKDTTQGSQTQVYVKRADTPTVFAVGDWTFRTLSKDAPQFRDKTVFAFDPSRVGHIVLARKDRVNVTMSRTGDGPWIVEGEEATKAKNDAISRFVDDVHDLRGSGIAAEPPGALSRFGLDAPDLRITLDDKSGGGQIATVLLAKHDGKYYAMAQGGGVVFEVRDYMFTRLDKQPKDFLASEADKAAKPAAPSPTQPPADDEAAPGDEEQDE